MIPTATVPFRSHAVVGVAGLIGFVVLFSWSWALPLLVAVLFAGAFVGLCTPGARYALVLGCLVGLVGAGASVALYANGVPRALVSSGPSVALGGMPSLYALLFTLVERGPAGTVTGLGVALMLVLGAAGTGAVAGLTALALSRRADAAVRTRRLIAVAVVAVVCASYAHTAWRASAPVVENADREPARGRYAYDATVYLKTYYRMLAGQGYYDALVEAASGDARFIKDGSVRDGRYHPGWMWGPSAMRRPTIFYVWRYAAPNGGGGIVSLAIIASTLALAALAWGLTPYLAHRAVFIPVFAMPYMLFMTLGRNVFFPDYWGALLTCGALALVMRRKWLAAAGVLFASALVRETAGPALAVVAATLFVVWLRGGRCREWLARAGAFAVATVAWLGFERAHEALGAPYMAFEYASAPEILWRTAATRTLDEKLLRPTAYLVPGGFLRVRGVLLLLLAPLGFRAVLASQKEVRLVVVAYVLFWMAFLVAVGASSEYWGQTVMLPSFAGIGCLLAAADLLDRRWELAEPVSWA